MGILNQEAPSRENPLLTKIAKDAEAQVPKQLQGQFLSIMVAGGKLMWSQEMAQERKQFDEALKQQQNIPQTVAHTVIKICSIIQNESGSQKPLAAIGIAAPIFMAHVLQYIEGKYRIRIMENVIDQTAQLIQVNLMKLYGVTDQHLQALIQQRAQGPASQESTPPGPPMQQPAPPVETPEAS